MKTITMSQFRKQPGEYLLDVIRDRRSFLLTKAGKAVAKLVPVEDDVTIIERDGTIRGETPLSAGLREGGKP